MNQHPASPAAIGQFGDLGSVERIAKESGQHSELTAARMRRARRTMARHSADRYRGSPVRRRGQAAHGAVRHSLARNHALIDGNKRLALAAAIAFYGVNGRRLTLTNDEAYELIMAVAEGKLDSVDDIAAVLAAATTSRP
jgi:hypothetical protein